MVQQEQLVMKFKKGDIVEAAWDGKKKIIFQLHSDAKWDYYRTPWGHMSNEKSWWASGRHIDGVYKGTYCHTFHLEHCSLYDSFGLTKNIKEFKL